MGDLSTNFSAYHFKDNSAADVRATANENVGNFCYYPSLNTQSCIKGLFVVKNFCFWAVSGGQSGADHKQLLRVFFSCFREQKEKFTFF